jgi:Major intrinsic protein
VLTCIKGQIGATVGASISYHREALLIFYALEDRSPRFILVFAGACVLASDPEVFFKRRSFSGILELSTALTLIHLISIPVTNASVNPARSTGPALFAGASISDSSGCFGGAPLISAASNGGGRSLRAPYIPNHIIEYV